MNDAFVEQGELDFGIIPASEYFACKEGVIFTLIRKTCPLCRITYRKMKNSSRRQFKIEIPGKHTMLLCFTEPFLYSRTLEELREDVLFNLDYMASMDGPSRAVFGKGCVRIRDR